MDDDRPAGHGSRPPPLSDLPESGGSGQHEDRPEWWKEAAAEFRAHGLGPYRPPRFADGAYRHRVVEQLESELGVEIRFVGVDVRHGDAWETRVDGEAIGEIHRYRHPDGYTVFEMDGAAFVEWVRSHVGAHESG